MLTALLRLFGVDLEHQILVLKGHAHELIEDGTGRFAQEATDTGLTIGLAALGALAAAVTVAAGLCGLFLWVDQFDGPLIALSAVAGVTAALAIVMFALAWGRSRRAESRRQHRPALTLSPTPTPRPPAPRPAPPLDLSSLVPPPPANANVLDLLTHRVTHRLASASDEAIDTATGLVREGSRGALLGTLALTVAAGVLIGRRKVHH
jgi:hypothetical protein